MGRKQAGKARQDSHSRAAAIVVNHHRCIWAPPELRVNAATVPAALDMRRMLDDARANMAFCYHFERWREAAKAERACTCSHWLVAVLCPVVSERKRQQ